MREKGKTNHKVNHLTDGEEVLYHRKGLVTKNDILQILPEVEKILDELEVEKMVKRKIINIAIESLQNLQIHSYLDVKKSYEEEPEFSFGRTNGSFHISIGNLIKNGEIQLLKDRLKKINSLDEDEVKYLYSVIMKQTFVKFSDKGGAGLGLVDMRKKSGEPLQFKFSDIDGDVSYFRLKIEVPYLVKEK